MGTWAVQEATTRWSRVRWSRTLADQGKESGGRIRERVGVIVTQMLGDDDERAGQEVSSDRDDLDETYPYYLAKDRLALDQEPSSKDESAKGEPAEGEQPPTEPRPDSAADKASLDSAASDNTVVDTPAIADAPAETHTRAEGRSSGQKQRHTPRHAAPPAPLASKLTSAKLPGFAPRSSHAGW